MDVEVQEVHLATYGVLDGETCGWAPCSFFEKFAFFKASWRNRDLLIYIYITDKVARHSNVN